MPVGKKKQRPRRRDEESGDESHSGDESSSIASAGSVSEGSDDEREQEGEEDGVAEGSVAGETPNENTEEDAEKNGASDAEDNASDAHIPEIPFEEFTASPPPTSQPRPPRASNRTAYLAKIASDPTYVPRVGKFWTHDERHYAAGKVGEGEYAGLREMSEFWRGRGRGRGRGGGAAGVRGRGRGARFASEARNTTGAPSGARHPSSEARNPSGEARNPSGEARTPPPRDLEDSGATSIPPSTDAPSAHTAPTAPSATTSAAKQSAWSGPPGRSDRGSWAHDGYAELAREEAARSAARERQRGRGRGMVSGMFRGRGRGQAHVQGQPLESTPVVEPATPEQAPFDAGAPSDATTAAVESTAPPNPPFSDHEPSAITANLQSQAEAASLLQQQQLAAAADAAARLAHLDMSPSPRPPSGPPSILPPGIAMAPNGTYYDTYTGQPVVWVPSPVPRYPDPYPPAYPPYPPYPYYRQDYYPPPQPQPYRNASPFPAFATDPSYFIPPRPQSKIEIRAPGETPTRNPNAEAIAAATLKDPARYAHEAYAGGGYYQ